MSARQATTVLGGLRTSGLVPTALVLSGLTYGLFLAVAMSATPGPVADLADRVPATPAFVLEAWVNNVAIAGVLWLLLGYLVWRLGPDRGRVALVGATGVLALAWAARAGLAAAELGGRDLGLGTIVAETAPHALPELALVLLPAAWALSGARRPSAGLLAAVPAGLLACAMVEALV